MYSFQFYIRCSTEIGISLMSAKLVYLILILSADLGPHLFWEIPKFRVVNFLDCTGAVGLYLCYTYEWYLVIFGRYLNLVNVSV